MDWTEEASLRLIECYRQKELLWNTRNPDHFNKTQRFIAWEDIAEDMGISPEECKKKMSILLASMRRVKSKLRKSLQAGTGETHKCTWFAFKSLQFMWAKNLQRNVSSTEPQIELQDDLPAVDSREDSDTPQADEQHPEPSQTDISIPRKRQRRMKPSATEARFLANPTLSRKDSYTVFGEFVGDSVRNLQNKRLESWARHQINNVLYMAEQISFQNSSDDLPPNLINFNPNQVFATVNPMDLLASSAHSSNAPSSPRPSDSSKNAGIFFKEEPAYSDPPSPT